MKFIIIFLFAAGLQVSATGYSQITLSQNNVSLKKIFREIEKQSAYLFLYKDKLLKNTEDVSINVTGASVEEVLDACLKNEPLSYKIVGKIIVIKAKERTDIVKPAITILPEAPLNIINGTVKDDKGNPLAGVSVVIKGSAKGTSTGVNGSFKIDANVGDVLEFTIVGYQKKSVTVGKQTEINVTLELAVSGLSDIVVVGYGTQRRADLTGSVATVDAKQLENRPLPNVGAALTGLSPNLNISLDGLMGGEPGHGYDFSIRGMGSINGKSSPLILVDGVASNINNIDPQDIATVSVLKDAAASAIYGSRAPFGVILITTKKGRRDGSVSVQYNGEMIMGSLLGVPHYENSLIYGTALNQASANAHQPDFFNAAFMERIKGYINGTYPYPYDPANPPTSVFNGRTLGNDNRDYPYIYLKNHKIDSRHNINVSGGNERVQYYVSAGRFDQGGFYNYGYDQYLRYDVLANLEIKATNWLRLGVNTKYTNSKTDYPEGITSVDKNYFFDQSFFVYGPNTPMYNINGTLYNPLLNNLERAGRVKSNPDDLVMTLKGELEPIKGWKTNISYTYNPANVNGTDNPKPVLVEVGNGTIGNIGKPSSQYKSDFSFSRYSLFNVTTGYDKTLGDHKLNALVGYEEEYNFYSSLHSEGVGLITDEVLSLTTTIGNKTTSDRKSDWGTQGVFGRLNYSYRDKYLLGISGRYNGSSKFASNRRWGFFPSASAGYVISNESFWEPLNKYVNFFKIRGSYGSLGNQNVADYLYIPVLNITSEHPNWIIDGVREPMAGIPNIISDNLTWETVRTSNIGLDAEFLNSHLNASLDLFKRETVDMIGPTETLPYILGAGSPPTNNASMRTTGFELSANWHDRLSNGLTYNVGIILGNNKSKILKYKNDKGLINTWYDGKNVGEIWGFISDGLIQEIGEKMPDQSAIDTRWGPGDMKYKDLTGDGKITKGSQTLNDHGDLTVIGNTTPQYEFGITGGAQWKGFDLYLQFHGLLRQQLPFGTATREIFWGLGTSYAVTGIFKGSPALDYWRPANETNILGPNTNAYLPKPYLSNETQKNREYQSRYVLNGAYMRLRFLQLGYTIPQEISKRAFINKLRIFLAGSNLFTITGLPKAMDPVQTPVASVKSNSPGMFYPVGRSYTVGLSITF